MQRDIYGPLTNVYQGELKLRAPCPASCPPQSTSGAMDKFTARPEGTGGGVAKRTKIVLKTRTYMDGGYMKSVNEEVEVTDDEEASTAVGSADCSRVIS